jgi:acyl-CoA reductase-like NAD-dependent aldehyde dehydrogenase
MVEHPDVNLIAFTGSTNIGFKLGEICGRTNKKCSLEMGGKNAQIVMPDANLNSLLKCFMGCFRNNRTTLHCYFTPNRSQRLL